jgi:RNA-directed DNA polymerase
VKPSEALQRRSTARDRHAEGRGASDLLTRRSRERTCSAAWKRVKANKGSAGVDGRTLSRRPEYLPRTGRDSARLLKGTYRPEPVRRVTIPKPDGGERELGIPTVTDRLIQQALLQCCNP